MITLNVTGMSCQHCVKAVKEAVGAVDGTAGVDVSLDAGTVSIESPLPAENFVTAIEDAGYEVVR